MVTFHRIDDATTRVRPQLELEPEGLAEKAGAVTGVIGHRVQGDLDRFTTVVESMSRESGGRRGIVPASPQRPQGEG